MNIIFELIDRLSIGWRMTEVKYLCFDMDKRKTFNIYKDRRGKLWVSTSPIHLLRDEYHYE